MIEIAAIPTKYASVQFRSRLEARWAAFFDLVGWKWDYEPIDLAGYIPDFLVTRHRGEQFLVEVKPFSEWPCSVLGCTSCTKSHGNTSAYPVHRSMMDEAIIKIQRSGWSRNAVIVGAVLAAPRVLDVPRFGVAVDVVPGESRWFGTDTIVTQCRRCCRYLARPDVQDWSDWCDCDNSDRAPSTINPTSLWREAGNRVQWRSPR